MPTLKESGQKKKRKREASLPELEEKQDVKTEKRAATGLSVVPTAGGDDLDDFLFELHDRNTDSEDAAVAATDLQEAKEVPVTEKIAKSKRQQTTASEEEEGQEKPPTAEEVAAKANRRKKSRERLKAKRLSASNWEHSKAATSSIAEATSHEQSDWLWDSYSASFGASFLEKGGLEESCIVQIGQQGSFEDRLCSLHKGWGEQLANTDATEHGSPFVILLAASAVAANDLVKKLPNLNKTCRAAKLFAKHFKVEEQQKELDSRCVNIATGTPNRVSKLADAGNLRLDRFQLLVMDVAIDAKQRSILDIPEVRGDLWLFFKQHLKSRVASGQAKIALIDSSKL